MNRFIISESEKIKILNKHYKFNNNLLKEQEIKPGVKNDDVIVLQNLLKQKFGVNLQSDGLIGPITLTYALQALQGNLKRPIYKPKANNKIISKTPDNGDTEVTQGLRNASLGGQSQSIDDKYKLPTTDFTKYRPNPFNTSLGGGLTGPLDNKKNIEVS